MTALVVAGAAVALVTYVALRRSRSYGVPLDPWPIIGPMHARDLFERNLPRPGTPICGAAPPAALIREMAGKVDGFVGVTYCHLEPAVTRMHVGIVVTRPSSPPFDPLLMQHTWLEPPRYYRRRRWAWWRRALIKVATA